MGKHGASDLGQKPLWGAILCWTAILPEERSAMSDKATEMGAITKLDLTSDVTHLIVGNIDTPKYKYIAKERQDIKVLRPGWLEKVRESWLEAEELDVAALEQEYRLPTFYGLQICVTGFDDADERVGLQQAVNDNGGLYQGDLTKEVTHLVAAEAKGKKYEYAGMWHIKRVSIEWIRDSLKRGMALDETCYSLDKPLEDRGIGAITGQAVSTTHLGKRQRADELLQEQTDAGRRKLRRTASSKLNSQGGDFWADMGSDNKLPTPKPESQVFEITKQTTEEDSIPAQIQTVKHVGESMPPMPEPEKARNLEPRRGACFLDPGRPYTNQYIVYGFNAQKTSLLSAHMRPLGAETFDEPWLRESHLEEPELCTWLLPYDAERSVLDSVPQETAHIYDDDILLTEIWLEKCLHSKAYVDPDAHPLYRPFVAARIPGFQSLTICPTSFSGVDLLHFSKAAKATGATYDETLRKQTSVLVCNSEVSLNADKVRYALENEVPVVSQQWLWDCMRASELLIFDDYTIDRTGFSQSARSLPREALSASKVSTPQLMGARPSSFMRKRASGSRSQRVGQLHFSVEVKRDPSPELAPVVTFEATLSPEVMSRPLQDISPNLSPRKQAQPSHSKLREPSHDVRRSSQDEPFTINDPERESILTADDDSLLPEIHDKPPADEVELVPPRTANTINSAIATLLAHKQKESAERPSSASSEIKPSSLTRKKRPLGRAPSHGSTALAPHASLDIDTTKTASTNRNYGPFELDEDDAEAARPQMLQPSQALGYEDPEGAAVRARLMSKFGHDGVTDLDETSVQMKRVESIGRVTDVSRDPVEEKNRRRALRRK